MPKLDGTHIVERLRERLEKLRSGEEVAKREIEALLTSEQVTAMNASWQQQQELRNGKRARTKEQEKKLGWKTKREIQIEAYERAIVEADEGMIETFEELQRKAKVKQAQTYLASFDKAIKAGKTVSVAQKLANNDLTREGLNRLDGKKVARKSGRDREIFEQEQQILGRKISEMTAEELEQLELMEEHEKALRKKSKKLGR